MVAGAQVACLRTYGAIWQPFCGAVLFAAHDDDGATVGLSDAQRDALLTGTVSAPVVHH